MMKKLILGALGTVVMLCVILAGCKRDVISLFTASVTEITGSTALCGGEMTDDNGHTVSEMGICWSTSKKPTIKDNFIAAPARDIGSYTCQLSGLMPNTTYHVRAYATCEKGIYYGNVVTFTTNITPRDSTVTDVDGNVYNTITIGNQTWMRENLRTKHFPDGESIPEVSVYYMGNYSQPRRYTPRNSDGNAPAEYGLLYNWTAVMNGEASSDRNPSGVQGICPDGWHVPSHTEWRQLILYVESQPQYYQEYGQDPTLIAKSLASTYGWDNSTTSASVGNIQALNNATGFSVLPAGCFGYIPDASEFGITDLHYAAYFWSASGADPAIAWMLTMASHNAVPYSLDMQKAEAYSVRCVKDH